MNLEELKEKKINMEQMFIFQELLQKINITNIADDIIEKIKEISKDNYTENELKEIEEIQRLDDEEAKLKKINMFHSNRTLRMGIEVNATVRTYIIKNLFKCQDLIVSLLESFGVTTKDLDIDIMMNVFNIMWNNGLHKIAFTYLKDKDIYAKKK